MNPRALIVLAAVGAVALVAVLAVVLTRPDGYSGPVVDLPTAAELPPTDANGVPEADWVDETSRATQIPARAVRAYAGAAARVSDEDETCRLAWNTLAGIGLSESSHGAFGGAELGEDGVVSIPIIGIPLDGNGVAAIEDTDGGRLDGDTEWDRAVGPMQFIPTTWAEWGADADGEGDGDPQNIDDAALAAGRYLCDAGDDLGEAEGWSRAVLTYNRSVDYATKVGRDASEYADAL